MILSGMRTLPLRRPALWLGALLLALGGTIGCTTLDEQQRKLIFSPVKGSWSGGTGVTSNAEDVWIEFDSAASGRPARLHALWMPADDPQAPALLYLHGARWDLSGSARRMQRMRELGFSVLGIDYRGFGRSGDELPSERMAYEDAAAGWRWLAEHAPDRPRYLFGHSLGSAIAVNLASEVPDAKGLILEGSFTSIRDVFSTFDWGWLPLGPLITQRFAASERIGLVKVPVLVVHGSEDRLIRPELGRALYEGALEPKRFVLVEGGTHHNTNSVGLPLYREALREMFGFGDPTGRADTPVAADETGAARTP